MQMLRLTEAHNVTTKTLTHLGPLKLRGRKVTLHEISTVTRVSDYQLLPNLEADNSNNYYELVPNIKPILL